jgi:coenzyme F420-0:L-glutamate ligase/coenzyme F420-1:gamma-L-glutamate ligase
MAVVDLPRMNSVELISLTRIPEVRPEDNLSEIVLSAAAESGLTFIKGDILALAQKIVSKAEGRYVRLSEVEPSKEATHIAERDGRDARLVEVVLRESNEIVVASDKALIVEHRSGAVCAHGGVDHSNLAGDEDYVLLLPEDADASARKIQSELKKKIDFPPAVLIVDTQGRAFRSGVVGVSIGCAGIEPLVDMRGELDRSGHRLEITQVAQADEIAAAASILMGQGAESIPAVIVRGYAYRPGGGPTSRLFRKKEDDLFRQ